MPANFKPNKISRSEVKKISRRTVEDYESRGLTSCVLNYKNCTATAFVGMAHSRRRNHIYTEEQAKAMIPACSGCHAKLDGLKLNDEGFHYNHEETEAIVLEKIMELDLL